MANAISFSADTSPAYIEFSQMETWLSADGAAAAELYGKWLHDFVQSSAAAAGARWFGDLNRMFVINVAGGSTTDVELPVETSQTPGKGAPR